jgi:hypothetical protein
LTFARRFRRKPNASAASRSISRPRAASKGGVEPMDATAGDLPSDVVLAALEDKRREGERVKYLAAVAEAEEVDEALPLVPAKNPIGLRIKHAAAVSRLPECGGRLAARRSAERAGLVASLDRDQAAMTLAYLPKVAHA